MILRINDNGTIRQFDIAQMSDISNIVADEYDATSTYAVGDIVLYNGTLYECTIAIQSAEEWTAGHWNAVTIVNELDDKYEKPSGGIPASDLSNAVQTSLGKADTALQTAPTPDWNAASGADGYIDNKPNIKQGTDTNHTAVVEGFSTTASGVYAHAEGAGTTASGGYSHVEGGGSQATAYYAHAEGGGTTASGANSHAEGAGTTASRTNSHAEGGGTTASGDQSHAEGGSTTASGTNSHAEGGWTTASGEASHAGGNGTVANHRSQYTFGEYNIADSSSETGSLRGNYIEIVGNGTYYARSNARTLDWSGNEVLAGKLTVGAAPTNNMDVATKQYVDNSIVQEIFVGSTTPSGYTIYIDPDGSLSYAQGVNF